MNFVTEQSEQSVDYVLRQAYALRATGNWGDAERQLAAAVAAWPNDQTVLLEWALIAHAQQHWGDMAERFGVVRTRYPGHFMGYSRGTWALRALKRVEEAEAVASAGVRRFPDRVELLVQWTLVACDRGDWSEAEARAETMLARQPDVAKLYCFAAEAYVRQQRHGEADARLGEGLQRLGLVPELVLRFAEIASQRQDWPRAVRRWAAARDQLPDRPVAHRLLTVALAADGRLDEAEHVVREATARFPDDKDLAIEHAWVATKREAWDEALLRWQSLHDRYPRDFAIDAGLAHVRALTEAEITSPPTSPQLENHVLDRHVIMADPKRLLWQFESLGENCEFGFVQRHFEIEPISLFRWAGNSYPQLMQAIDSDFDGVGELSNTRLSVDKNNKFIVNDRRLGFDMHTFIDVGQVEPERFLAAQAKRLRFLVRKFREEVAIAERILVRSTNKPVTSEQVRRLHQALRRYGPVVLLHVTEATEPSKIGTVEWLDHDLMVGSIDRLGRQPGDIWDVSFDVWLEICRAAFGLRARGYQ